EPTQAEAVRTRRMNATPPSLRHRLVREDALTPAHHRRSATCSPRKAWPVSQLRSESVAREPTQELGFDSVADGDEVFRHLVLARLIEPSSKLDSLRVIEKTGPVPASYATLKRRLPRYTEPAFRQQLAAACARAAD